MLYNLIPCCAYPYVTSYEIEKYCFFFKNHGNNLNYNSLLLSLQE